MSLKVSFELETSRHSLDLTYIMPTRFRQVAFDYSTGDKRVIVAACDAADTVGLIYAADTDSWAQIEAGSHMDDLGLEPAFTVESGTSRAARFTRASGEAGRLVFTHIQGYQPREMHSRRPKR